jgi:hypothetical protein
MRRLDVFSSLRIFESDSQGLWFDFVEEACGGGDGQVGVAVQYNVAASGDDC